MVMVEVFPNMNNFMQTYGRICRIGRNHPNYPGFSFFPDLNGMGIEFTPSFNIHIAFSLFAGLREVMMYSISLSRFLLLLRSNILLCVLVRGQFVQFSASTDLKNYVVVRPQLGISYTG